MIQLCYLNTKRKVKEPGLYSKGPGRKDSIPNTRLWVGMEYSDGLGLDSILNTFLCGAMEYNDSLV